MCPALELLALVAGQDVEEDDHGISRTARGVVKDRVISTVDVEARRGHTSPDRRFDCDEAHLTVDPDSELASGGRRGCTRGRDRIITDLDTRASARNWVRLTALGLGRDDTRWVMETT